MLKSMHKRIHIILLHMHAYRLLTFLPTFGPCLRYKLGLTNTFDYKSPAHFRAISAVGLQWGGGAQKQTSRENHNYVHHWCHLKSTSTCTDHTHTNASRPFSTVCYTCGTKALVRFHTTFRKGYLNVTHRQNRQTIFAGFVTCGWFLVSVWCAVMVHKRINFFIQVF